MPINLRYGQQAVARGFINKARLDQCLAKQKQLEAQGKKVSLRMILEKAKLLSPDQLSMIDRDLNIKVVKKQTAQIQKPGAKQPARKTGPTGAQDFAGGEVPKFSGMQGADPDATVFSPPPAEMQAKIKAERDRAKNEAKRKQEQEASAFFGDDNASPFGGDPFGGGGDMSPQPFGGDMQPEPFGGEMQPEPFGGEMQPEPFGGEMQPEPMGFGGGDLAPEPMGFGDDSGEPQELSRMDSSPKISSLSAEYDNFASPDEEALPTIGAFDEAPAPPRGGRNAPPPRQDFGEAALAPAGDDFENFGNDFRSPEEMEMSAPPKTPAGGIDATMFSPPPPGLSKSGRQKTGAMDRTVFSPRPPEFGGAQPMEAEPAPNDWGEEPAPAFDEEPMAEPAPAQEEEPVGAGMDATLYSPPPSAPPKGRDADRKDTGRKPLMREPAKRDTGKAKGRQGADDFADIELPKGRVIDDVPTAPASMEDEVHPLRRGVGTSSAPIKRTTGKPQTFDEPVADELPSEAPSVDVPDETGQLVDEPAMAGAPAGKGKLPAKAAKEAKAAKAAKEKAELPQREVPAAGAGKEKKGAGKRVLLIFTLLLALVVGVLTLPVALYDVKGAEFVRDIRDHPQAKPIYDYVDYEIFNRFREWTKMPLKEKPKKKEVQFEVNTNKPTDPPAADGANTEPADG